MSGALISPCPTDTPGLRAHRACRHCVQIKAKCLPLEGPGNTTCQRCHRLGKQCTTPAPVPRTPHRKKSTRISQLEERIEKLTNLLTAGQKSSDVLGLASLPTSPTFISSTSNCEPSAPGVQELCIILDADILEDSHRYPEYREDTIDRDAINRFRINVTPVVEERLFTIFRTDMIKYFPFIVIPPQATAADIRKDKPFLFRTCITAACHGDLILQLSLGEELVQSLGERMLLRGEKSMDILQGVLVLIAWHQYFNHDHHPNLMNLVHLAMAAVVDLGLNRPYGSDKSSLAEIGTETTQVIQPISRSLYQGIQTSDERRAILAVYFFTGQLSSSSQILDPMRWSQVLENACQSLKAEAEYPSDGCLLQFIQLHRVVEKYFHFSELQLSAGVPIQTYVKCFEEDLLRFKLQLPPEARVNNLLQMYICYAEIALYETAQTVNCDATIYRAQALHACLERINTFFERLTSESPVCIPYLPFRVWTHVVHALTVLAKLSFLVIDGWDFQYARNCRLNFTYATEKLAAQMEAVGQFATGPQSHVIAARSARLAGKLRVMKTWYESKLKAEIETAETAGNDMGSALPAFDASLEGFFDGFVDPAWQDLVGDWTSNMRF